MTVIPLSVSLWNVLSDPVLTSQYHQYRMTVIPLSVSLWNVLSDPVFDGMELVGFKSRVNAFLLA